MQPKETCGALIGYATIGGNKLPMTCCKSKGHPEKELHTPGPFLGIPGQPNDAALKAFGAGIPRPTAPAKPASPPQTPQRPPLSARLRRRKIENSSK